MDLTVGSKFASLCEIENMSKSLQVSQSKFSGSSFGSD